MKRQAAIKRAQARRGMGQAGFTLIEIVVASMLFAIGSMAVLTMMFSSLQAYASSRDQTIASDIAARVASMMKMEAKMGQSILASGAPSPYTGGPVGNGMPIIAPLNAAGAMWTNWAALTAAPVDERMTLSGATRYCVFIRGGQLQSAVAQAANAVAMGPQATVGVTIQAQIAVVYPAANGTFNNANDCTASLTAAGGVGALSPLNASTGDAALALELIGLRVVYSGVLATVRR
jgi:prepilin-type N-terminal cleavage/methylation domain-containing protein